MWARARDGAGRDELVRVGSSAPLYHPRQDAARGRGTRRRVLRAKRSHTGARVGASQAVAHTCSL